MAAADGGGGRRARLPAAGEARWMLAAIAAARKNLGRADGGPFGACVVRGDELVAVARNTVLSARDPTCHAEVRAIRIAARRLGSHELAGCRIYSTTEPCPMCFGAIHWAGIATVVSGTRIADVARLGFRELAISNRRMKSLGGSPITLVEGFLREECLALLRDWEKRHRDCVY